MSREKFVVSRVSNGFILKEIDFDGEDLEGIVEHSPKIVMDRVYEWAKRVEDTS